MNAEILIMAACGAGFGWSCWKAGLKQGASNCIDVLYKKKIICYDNKGDIKPNQFFQKEEE